ncbi:hypothetical protein HX057_08120 [Myroides odoratimimus]|uniref:Uncharacterized protein n=2 Tax=Myroides odoratimimus TaxID=76832 RepID=A0ABP2NAY9_9FLAO|nr:hypothetical protein [Myroides odoratimimus]EHO08043.1 hypothetical protein HMPREF9715_02673 [Myroides odoratimimus CIP 101113]EHO09410.1 hypothetical protein HMPREF9712_01719 [Myroides odoratimimus CCUG 10230]MCS7474454.1 hypothetical protein [Myroides odoratimimus]MDM1414402.1 hypothetical protein [Myroides odoratimimus]MDM1446717.1 hypothetical protein [Myroides odoratimimus]
MKKIYLSIAISFLATAGFAQTKIGVVGKSNPDVNSNAILELEAENKGLLLPRVTLSKTTEAAPLKAHVAGMTVYNTKDGDKTKGEDVVKGFYYNDGTKWQQMVTTDNKAVKFFYMPTITFDTSVLGDGTKELYEEYKKQFTMTSGNAVKSTSAPAVIPHFPAASDLYYYVTDFDPAVFSDIVIDDNGVMTYKIIGNGTPTSIMNIVFVVK